MAVKLFLSPPSACIYRDILNHVFKPGVVVPACNLGTCKAGRNSSTSRAALATGDFILKNKNKQTSKTNKEPKKP